MSSVTWDEIIAECKDNPLTRTEWKERKMAKNKDEEPVRLEQLAYQIGGEAQRMLDAITDMGTRLKSTPWPDNADRDAAIHNLRQAYLLVKGARMHLGVVHDATKARIRKQK